MARIRRRRAGLADPVQAHPRGARDGQRIDLESLRQDLADSPQAILLTLREWGMAYQRDHGMPVSETYCAAAPGSTEAA